MAGITDIHQLVNAVLTSATMQTGAKKDLRALREARHLSQEDVARELDMSVKTVIRRERDLRIDTPTGRRILALLEGHEDVTDDGRHATPTDQISDNAQSESIPENDGKPQPTVFRRYAILRARLSKAAQEDVAAFEAEMFRATENFISDPEERYEQAVQSTVRYVERRYTNPQAASSHVRSDNVPEE